MWLVDIRRYINEVKYIFIKHTHIIQKTYSGIWKRFPENSVSFSINTGWNRVHYDNREKFPEHYVFFWESVFIWGITFMMNLEAKVVSTTTIWFIVLINPTLTAYQVVTGGNLMTVLHSFTDHVTGNIILRSGDEQFGLSLSLPLSLSLSLSVCVCDEVVPNNWYDVRTWARRLSTIGSLWTRGSITHVQSTTVLHPLQMRL